MRLNWLNWESQKRTTWKISSRTTEKHNPPCMLSRTVPLCYQPLHLVTFCCISTELLDPRQIVKIEKPECQWLQQVSILLQWWFVIIRELHQSSFWKQKEQKITSHYTCDRQYKKRPCVTVEKPFSSASTSKITASEQEKRWGKAIQELTCVSFPENNWASVGCTQPVCGTLFFWSERKQKACVSFTGSMTFSCPTSPPS